MLFLLISLLLPFSVDCAFVCPGGLITLTSTFSIPTDFVTPGTSCVFSIAYNPPSLFNSTFATVLFKASNSNYDDFVWISDTYGSTVDIKTVSSVIAIPPPRLTINITAGPRSTMMLGMMVTKQSSAPFNVRQASYTVHMNLPAQFIELRKMTAPFYNVIQRGNSEVYLNVAAPFGVNLAALMNAFVYDGIKAGAALKGTLYSVFANGPLVSTKGVFTIYSAASIDYDGLVMVTDFSNVNRYESYDVLWSDFDSDSVQGITMKANNGPTALTLLSKMDYSNPMYVTGVVLSPNDTVLNSYAQTPLANRNLMPTLQNFSKPYDIYYPQMFDSYARTFVLDKGQAFLEYTTDKSQSSNNKAYPNRMGFIATQDYGIWSTNLHSSVQELHADFTFTLNMLVHAAAPSTIISVQNFDTTETKFFRITPETLTQPILVTGLRNVVVYISSDYNNPSTGSLVYYVVVKTAPAVPTLPPSNNSTANGAKTNTPTPLPHTESTTKGVLGITYATGLLFAICRMMW